MKISKQEWKRSYFQRLIGYLEQYGKCLIVQADHVGSKQMQETRQALRNHGIIFMGKNTMMRKVIKGHLDKNPNLHKILPYLVQNVGFIFTNSDLSEIRRILLQHKKKVQARAGSIAPCDVIITARNTGLGPEKTGFFQAVQIPTKIVRGTIEILHDVSLINEGEKVGLSEATLLNMLKISPFSYGLEVQQVYDMGTTYSSRVLDITEDDLRDKFCEGISNIAATSLVLGIPTSASIPHSMMSGFKNLLCVAMATDITFKEAETVKEYIKNPKKFHVEPIHSDDTSETESHEEISNGCCYCMLFD